MDSSTCRTRSLSSPKKGLLLCESRKTGKLLTQENKQGGELFKVLFVPRVLSRGQCCEAVSSLPVMTAPRVGTIVLLAQQIAIQSLLSN